MKTENDPVPRKKVDLRKLPAWLQYLIALSVVAFVVTAAWVVGKGRPIPSWITRYLIPILGWTYLALLVSVILRRVIKK